MCLKHPDQSVSPQRAGSDLFYKISKKSTFEVRTSKMPCNEVRTSLRFESGEAPSCRRGY
jgi:hypothetical protein